MLFRILTENKNKRSIIALMVSAYLGFTLYEAYGYWNGQGEKALIIEVANADRDTINAIAEAIKVINNQEAVLIQRLRVESTYK